MLSPPVPEMQRSTLRTRHLHMQQLNLIIDAKEKEQSFAPRFWWTFGDLLPCSIWTKKVPTNGQNVHPRMSIQMDDFPCSQKEKMCHKTFDKDPTSIVSIHFNLNLLVCVIYQPFFYAQHVWTKKRCISHFSSFSSWLAMSEQQKIQAEKIAAVNWTDSSNSPAWSLCTKRLQASVETHCNRRIPWDIFTYMNPISSR